MCFNGVRLYQSQARPHTVHSSRLLQGTGMLNLCKVVELELVIVREVRDCAINALNIVLSREGATAILSQAVKVPKRWENSGG